MERSLIANAKAGERNKLQGFVENIRNKRTMAFLVLRDYTGRIQLTIEKEKYPDIAAKVDTLTVESVITVEGEVVENSFVKMGGREMLPDAMTVESIAEPLPISKDAAIDSRLDYRWIDLRSDRNTLIFKAQTELVAAMREFLLERNFMEIHTPKLIGAASESGSEVFELKYFDRKAYLSQSPQFYKQMAMAAGFDRIFEVGPVFRAEKSFTNKHATEFTGFDLEMSYITSFRDVMAIEAELLTAALERVQKKYGAQIKEQFGLEVVVPTLPFPEMKLADVYKELEERYGYTCDESEKNDLTTDAE
ncbi:MAG: OB-fold nucleic acid binding domain-containing protein, partial [Clostridia bacterium]|nr:OB-fold nucleic acid binding domain-containing protein [Clostridia bacterium]